MLKNKIIYTIILVFLLFSVKAQSVINLSGHSVCGIERRIDISSSLSVFPADSKIMDLLNKINDIAGFPVNYTVYATNNSESVPFAAVSSDAPNSRLIIYPPSFLSKINVGDGRYKDWNFVYILAHEVGHHIAGHTLTDNGERKKQELDADYFAGFVMAKLGAAQNEVLQAINFLTENPTDDEHPPKAERVSKVLDGWTKGSKPIIPMAVPQEECKEIASDMLIINNNPTKVRMLNGVILETGNAWGGQAAPKYANLTILPKGNNVTLRKVPIGTHILSYEDDQPNVGMKVWGGERRITFTVLGCNPNNQLILE